MSAWRVALCLPLGRTVRLFSRPIAALCWRTLGLDETVPSGMGDVRTDGNLCSLGSVSQAESAASGRRCGEEGNK